MLNVRTPDGKKHYYLFDNLDSVVGLTESSTGNKDNSYDYDPAGQVKAQVEGENNPWKFASGFYDSSTGLYHFGARYYDPSLGRWTQQDPVAGSLGDLGSANRYVYAGDDPVNLVDPSGKSVISFLNCLGGWLGAIVTVVGFAAIVFAIGAAIIGAIATLNPLIGMFIFMAAVLASALAIGAVAVNVYNSAVAPSCGYALLM